MASIWEAFYRSYSQKQAMEQQKEQFSQEMALRQAANRLAERAQVFQEEKAFPAEQYYRKETLRQGDVGLDLQGRQISNAREYNMANLALQGRYASVSEAENRRKEVMFNTQLPLIQEAIADQRMIKRVTKDVLSESVDPLTGYSKVLGTGNPAVINALMPMLQQRAAVERSMVSKVGKFQEPSVFGIPIAPKFDVREEPGKAIGYGIASRLLGGVFDDTRYSYEETSPRAKALSGFLGAMQFRQNPIPSTTAEWDQYISYLNQSQMGGQ